MQSFFIVVSFFATREILFFYLAFNYFKFSVYKAWWLYETIFISFLTTFESVLIYESCMCMAFELSAIINVSWSILQPEAFPINTKALNR